MKTRISTLLVVLTILSANLNGEAFSVASFMALEDYDHPLATSIRTLEEASQKKEYKKLYELFSPKFKESISEEAFEERINKEWELVSFSPVYGLEEGDHGYVIFHSNEKDGSGTKLSTKILFYSKIGEEYKIDSFPFYRTNIRVYAETPNFMKDGIYGK